MHTYRRFKVFGALTLFGLVATMILQDGWQSAAAAFAMFNGFGLVLTFAVLGARSDRPRPARPAWAQASARAQGLAAETAPRRVAAPRPETSRVRPSGRRPLPARGPRPVT
jgi:hypothetical protein